MNDSCPRCRSRVFVDSDGLSVKCGACGWRKYVFTGELPSKPRPQPKRGHLCVGFGGQPCPNEVILTTHHKRCPDCRGIDKEMWINQHARLNHKNSSKSPWRMFVNYRREQR